MGRTVREASGGHGTSGTMGLASTGYSVTTRAVTMPNMPSRPSTWGRMWQGSVAGVQGGERMGRLAMKISARNQFAGTVSSVKEGSVMAEVDVKLDAGPEMVAAITRDSARRLHLGQGSKVVLIVKATDVMVVVPE